MNMKTDIPYSFFIIFPFFVILSLRLETSLPVHKTSALLFPEVYFVVGSTPGLIRIAVGLEHHEDILGDVEQALG